MKATGPGPNASPGGLGDLLRYWRDIRGVSQLDLSLESGISQRQVSFIESGRSVPGRDTLLTLAQTLDVPLRERNALLLAAGYAPVYSEAPWNAREMHGVIRALERVVRQHEPFPAIVMDRHWNVLMTNDSAPRFFDCFIDMASRQGPRNMLHLIFDPAGMRPFVADWERCREVCCNGCIGNRSVTWSTPERGVCSMNCSRTPTCRAIGTCIMDRPSPPRCRSSPSASSMMERCFDTSRW